jgi:hypothetical protein
MFLPIKVFFSVQFSMQISFAILSTAGCMTDRHLDALPVPIAIELGGDKLSIGKTLRYLGLEGLFSSKPVMLVKLRMLMP